MTFDSTTLLIIGAVLAVLILAFLLLRPRRGRQRIERKPEGSPYVASQERPYLKPRESLDGPQGNSVADEVATAATDVAGEVMGIDAGRGLAGAGELQQLKGVGPKFVARLNELGISRLEQLAGLNENEVEHLDERLGPFRGRLARDRVVEQARYLARGDKDGFEERFGKLGG